MIRNPNIRNIAIIAHVDHGKTTLVDGLLWQSGLFRENQHIAERAMDNIDIERERGITLVAKNASFVYKDVRINIVDTPGHADFGGEVERGLSMVDGALLLVDAAEGPLPQTRFVLRHALERNVKIVVVINKIDRPDARIPEVLEEIYQLFFDLEAADHHIDFPIMYTNARKRLACTDITKADEAKDLVPLFDAIIEHLPGPEVGEESLQLLISNTGYSDYLGRLAIGRVYSGTLKVGDKVLLSQEKGMTKETKITALMGYRGLATAPIEKVEAGDICIVAGIEELKIGDSVLSTVNPKPLPRIEIEPPTISIEMLVNSSPFCGQDGDRVTSRVIWDRVERELRTNVSLQAERSLEFADTIVLRGRGELQFTVLAEQMRREGYEFALGRPKVITKEIDGQLMEPQDHVIMDIPENCVGAVTERMGTRKGEMTNLEKRGNNVRIEFDIPSRGLIGYRSEFLNVTRGLGLMSSYLNGYIPWKGHILDRNNGAIVSDRKGTTTAYALYNLEPRGKMIIGEGVDVYEGMIVGENNKSNDINVDPTRGKKLTNIRSAGADEATTLTPVTPLTIEWGVAWLADDEVLEVTPKYLRLRKRILDSNKRSIIRKPKKSESDSDDDNNE